MKLFRNAYFLIATFFYIGYLPYVPGTFGSLAGVGLFLSLGGNFGIELVVLGIVLWLGFLASTKVERALDRKDPSCVVIDEVAGMMITFLFIPINAMSVVIGFLVFRLLDTLKPFPAYGLQKLHGGLGIMGDDIVAGVYSNIVLQAVLRLASFKVV